MIGEDKLVCNHFPILFNLICASIAKFSDDPVLQIPVQSLYEAKGTAGNIIPAIATTNAIIAGLQVRLLRSWADAHVAIYLLTLVQYACCYQLSLHPLQVRRWTVHLVGAVYGTLYQEFHWSAWDCRPRVVGADGCCCWQ